MGTAEFCCWVALGLVPFLYWVNGPAVSQDQLVMRTVLVIVAAVGAVGLRVREIVRRRKEECDKAE